MHSYILVISLHRCKWWFEEDAHHRAAGSTSISSRPTTELLPTLQNSWKITYSEPSTETPNPLMMLGEIKASGVLFQLERDSPSCRSWWFGRALPKRCTPSPFPHPFYHPKNTRVAVTLNVILLSKARHKTRCQYLKGAVRGCFWRLSCD